MQTFLPFSDFTKSAQALDNKRLNKQILECYQILKVLSNPDPRAGWRNHPAVKMWRGFEHLLLDYTMFMVKEANIRGIKTDKNVANIMELINTHGIDWGFDIPEWYTNDLTMKRLTTTHKANLYKKDPVYYYDFFSSVAESNPCCPDRKEPCKYYWVAHEQNVIEKAA
jgi:hypothetical protein